MRLALLPFGCTYGMLIRIRNLMFDTGKLPSKKYGIPVISVGNITVGGTGKTPLTELIIDTLKSDYKVGLISRGYKRKTKGVIVGTQNSTAQDLGDEPFQIKSKFPELLVTVAEKRVDGIDMMLQLPDSPDLVVMDDAYQHRYVSPGLSILVMDYNRPLWKDFMLPAGELREPVKGKKRANIIIVSKCPPSLSTEQQLYITQKLNLTTDQSVYFSSVAYQNSISLFCDHKQLTHKDFLEKEVLLVTGIANPEPLLKYLVSICKKVRTVHFPDHHQFTETDIKRINQEFEKIPNAGKMILTTEKDAVRFKEIINNTHVLAPHIWYIPIKVKMLNNQQEVFKEKIINYVKHNKRNS